MKQGSCGTTLTRQHSKFRKDSKISHWQFLKHSILLSDNIHKLNISLDIDLFTIDIFIFKESIVSQYHSKSDTNPYGNLLVFFLYFIVSP